MEIRDKWIWTTICSLHGDWSNNVTLKALLEELNLNILPQGKKAGFSEVLTFLMALGAGDIMFLSSKCQTLFGGNFLH